MDLPFGFGRFMDEYWEPYPGVVDIQSFGGQLRAPPQGHQFQRHLGQGHPAPAPPSQIDPFQGQLRYQYWPQQWMDTCAQSQSAMVVNGSIHDQKQTDPKPRLSKEEVESLEKEFAKNPKPNSSIKRDLAERLAVEVPRINNWFQNRRAKEKQIKKTREFEAQQARERAISESKSSGDEESDVVSEFYGLANHHRPAGPSSAAIGDDDEEDEDEEWACEENEQEEEEHEDKEAPVGGEEDEVVGPRAEEEEAVVELTPRYRQSFSSGNSKLDSIDHAGYPSLLSTANQDTPGIGADVARNDFHATDVQHDFQSPPEHPYNLDGGGQPRPTGLSSSAMGDLVSAHPDLVTDAMMFEDLQTSEYFGHPSMQPFLSEAVSDGLRDQPMASIEPRQHCDRLEEDIKVEHPSPTSMSHSPRSLTAQRFKSPPPPTDIASRRNIRRPPSLGPGSLRSFSYSHSQGPKTCIDVSRRPDAGPPMRRMTSSTVSLSGRIQKAGPVPRSPFGFDRNKTALLHTLQGCGSPGLATLNSALSPLSPQGLNVGENTAPANVSDEDAGFALGSYGAPCSTKMEQPMRTPPATPGLPSNFQEPMFYFQLDQPWSSVPQDEPLQTPSLGSHGGSEFEFSGYVVSQPATPSLPMHIGPAHGKGPSNVEYAFPDSFPGYSARSSPGQSKSHQFQFAQNVTPQDFNVER